MKRPAVRLLILTTEKDKPSVERDLSFIGHVDVLTDDSKIEHKGISEDESSTYSNGTEGSKIYPISLSSKVTKRNGTMYLAIFSVPLIKLESTEGNNLI